MQARAFPAFAVDPSAGSDWASRFSMEDNPQPALDWPVEDFAYSDEELQRVNEPLAFTIVDFLATDRRYARYFARVARSDWNANMTPLASWLTLDAGEQDGRVPYVLVVDERDVLHRLVVDATLVQAARRCREMWHRLQELGGIHDSHAERLLALAKSDWEEQQRGQLASPKNDASTAPPAETGAAAVAAAAAAAPVGSSPAAAEAAPLERPSDDPYIETTRCSSCNECTLINDRMFAYDANQQAYLADLGAGTYRELVEAAENCQLAIIHPGKPRDLHEPDLDELIKRAEPFA
jgi:hypothetical protein